MDFAQFRRVIRRKAVWRLVRALAQQALRAGRLMCEDYGISGVCQRVGEGLEGLRCGSAKRLTGRGAGAKAVATPFLSYLR